MKREEKRRRGAGERNGGKDFNTEFTEVGAQRTRRDCCRLDGRRQSET
jgi:hypothetical protein